ncbi:hypothetical protein DPMN_128396 [Dreissena polymorpha]|uniref:Kazal-like domain-containing protein n=1 Tax=Dreissena polymorpha TaxID=45954 RepID=A0A9D4JVP9_DREPO|nr:hypothetical protein DPMN_128396 [Dreissena polymorpha]
MLTTVGLICLALVAFVGGVTVSAPAHTTPGPHLCIYNCTMDNMPVCGVDGKTYPNWYSMKCECAGVAFFQEGPCTGTAQTLIAPGVGKRQAVIPCICTFIYQPVCGSNGQTFGNECTLRCDAKEE